MKRDEFLLKSSPSNIYYTWMALGSVYYNDNTYLYPKDSIFRVNTQGPLYNSIVYCKHEYYVNPSKGLDKINWTNVNADTLNGLIFFYQGVSSPNFRLLLTGDRVLEIEQELKENDPLGEGNIILPDNFIPFEGNKDRKALIDISDEEYILCTSELGIPFIREEELEYNRDTIINICIKPALDQFYAFYPIVVDESVGPVGSNQEFKVAYHDFENNPTLFAYKGIPYYVTGYGSGMASPHGSGAFNYLRTTGAGGNFGTGRFGGGLRYSKSVPGFTGGSQAIEATMNSMAAQQGYINHFKKEYLRDVWEYDKKYVKGFSTVGGSVNIHWLCADTNYDHTEYYHRPNIRKLCTAFALQNIGMLRSQIKPDDNSPLDYSLFTTRAEKLYDAVKEEWSKDPSALIFAISR